MTNEKQKLEELSQKIKEFKKWKEGKVLEERVLFSNFQHISSNILGCAEAILNLIGRGNNEYEKSIPYYIDGLNAYMELIDTNLSFKDREFRSAEGYFPDIDDTGTPTFNGIKIGGSCYYILEARKRIKSSQ